MKKKSALFAIVGVVAVAAIGMTFALSTNRTILGNSFVLSNYQTTVTDEFVSPKNWTACQIVPKEITVTNHSDKAVAVRIKLEEDWIAADGTTHLPVVSAASGLTMAQINFTANSGWTQDGQYYVYDTDLAPNATTNSLMTGVTLNCSANLDTSDGVAPDSDGAYAGGEYHLKATIQTIEADKRDEWKTTLAKAIIEQANAPYEIDFTRKAVVSDDEYTHNGNGVNKYTENGQDVYYYRGQIDNNNVVWADKCWKIVRTTYTGGTKMIYNGVPTEVDGKKQCLATGTDAQITYNGSNTFKFYDGDGLSPAEVGYMYGTRLDSGSFYVRAGAATFTFSNSVSRTGNTYTLDTSAGQSITGTWADVRVDAAKRYHYFCTDGTTVCDNNKIGYAIYFGSSTEGYCIPIGKFYGGYDNIDAVKTAMHANTYDSIAKAVIEAWFDVEGLDVYEDDLEDAIFCNDRSYISGALKSEDDDGIRFSYHAAYGRNVIKNAQDNFEPSLNCSDKNDSFTKDDVINGNGMLNHKVGLITADELTMAGSGYSGFDNTAYLYTGQQVWSASPAYFNSNSAVEFSWNSNMSSSSTTARGLRPMVSLKAGTEYTSGTGLKTDPYIVP